MSRDGFSYWDGRLGPDVDPINTPRSGVEATPDWYTSMVDELETEKLAHLNTRAILQDLIAELRKEPVQCSDPYCACPDCPQE